MTMATRIRNIVRDMKHRTRGTKGRAMQKAGNATGNTRLRRKGNAEIRKNTLAQLAKRVRQAIER